MKIAVSGKGGVGKTTIAGTLARLSVRKGYKVLAIDADPNPNLALTLGLPRDEASRILPISQNDQLIEEKTGIPVKSHGVHPELYSHMTITVDDIVDRFCVKAPEGVSLLVMGKVEHSGAGCLCASHSLIRTLTEHLLVERGEMVVMDMEAGVEHLSRGTAMYVDSMLIVTEPYLKSLDTALRVKNLSEELGIKKVHVVGNKVSKEVERRAIEEFCSKNSLKLMALIPYDERVMEAEVQGKAPIDFAEDSKAMAAIAELGSVLTKMA